MTAPVQETGSVADAQSEAMLSGLGARIEGYPLRQIAWMRFKRDKIAVASGIVVVSLTLPIEGSWCGGWIDSVISRLMDIFLAFPLLLFAIALSASLQGGAFRLHGLTLHISVLIFVIGFFSSP